MVHAVCVDGPCEGYTVSLNEALPEVVLPLREADSFAGVANTSPGLGCEIARYRVLPRMSSRETQFLEKWLEGYRTVLRVFMRGQRQVVALCREVRFSAADRSAIERLIGREFGRRVEFFDSGRVPYVFTEN